MDENPYPTVKYTGKGIESCRAFKWALDKYKQTSEEDRTKSPGKLSAI